MPDEDQLIDGVLIALAGDAFDVLNWARRNGMKRDKQLVQVMEAFRKTLADTKMRLVREETVL